MASCVWLLWLSVMSSRVSLAYVSNSLLFMVEYYSIVWIYCICLFSHESMGFSIVCTFGLLWTMLLWTFMYKFLCGCMFSFILGIYLGKELQDHVVTPCLTEELPNFSKMAATIYIPTNNILGFQFFYIFTKTCYFLSLI